MHIPSQSNKTVADLNLSYNDLGPKGGAAIAKALQLNHTVTHLNLRGNKFGTQGGLQIAAMLQVWKRCANLQSIHLSNDWHTLQINNTIQVVDVGETDLDIAAVIAFMTVLHHNRTVKTLNIDRPLIKSAQVLASCFKRVS